MSARIGAHKIAGVLGLLLGTTGAGASAAPAEEYLLDMAIAVHPQSERGSPAETAARVGAMLDEATRVVEGIDGVPPGEMSCPIRFRASNIHRYDGAPPAPPYACGTGRRDEAALFPESVLGEASGCANPVAQGLGMFVGSGFSRSPADAGITYAHEMGHLAGVPGDHAGWGGTLLGGSGVRTLDVPANLCQIYLDFARGAAARGSGLPPSPDPY